MYISYIYYYLSLNAQQTAQLTEIMFFNYSIKNS